MGYGSISFFDVDRIIPIELLPIHLDRLRFFLGSYLTPLSRELKARGEESMADTLCPVNGGIIRQSLLARRIAAAFGLQLPGPFGHPRWHRLTPLPTL